MGKNITIELLLLRNERGIDELLRHYGPLLRYVISPILKNDADIEECLSEITLRVWENIKTYDADRGSFNAWLTTVARNSALNRVRKSSFADSIDDIPEDTVSGDDTPEKTAIKNEQRALLRRELRQLSPEDRLLFYRKYYYLQSTRQIAAELGMTERAVEGRLYRIRKQLRSKLGGEIDE